MQMQPQQDLAPLMCKVMTELIFFEYEENIRGGVVGAVGLLLQSKY